METPQSFIANYRTAFEQFTEQRTQQIEGLLASCRKIRAATRQVRLLNTVAISPTVIGYRA